MWAIPTLATVLLALLAQPLPTSSFTAHPFGAHGRPGLQQQGRRAAPLSVQPGGTLSAPGARRGAHAVPPLRASGSSEEGDALRSEAERLMLQAERLRLEGERAALELAREKFEREKAKLKAAEASLARAQGPGAATDAAAMGTPVPPAAAAAAAAAAASDPAAVDAAGQASIRARLAAADARRRTLRDRWAALNDGQSGPNLSEDAQQVMRELDQLSADVEALEREIGMTGDGASSGATVGTAAAAAAAAELMPLRARLLRVCADGGVSGERAEALVEKFASAFAAAPARDQMPFTLQFREYLAPRDATDALDAPMSKEDAYWAVSSFETAFDMTVKDSKKWSRSKDEGWEAEQWSFAGTLANGLLAKERAGDTFVITAKRFLSGGSTDEDAARAAADALNAAAMGTAAADPDDMSETALISDFLTERRIELGTSAYLDASIIDTLRSDVFTEELMAAEAERRRRDAETSTRVGKLRGARLPAGAATMVAASGLAAVSITGEEEVEKTLAEVRRRLDACGLTDGVRLFVFRDITQAIAAAAEDDGSDDEAMLLDAVESEGDAMGALGIAIGRMFATKRRYLIVAAPARASPPAPAGGAAGSAALAALALYFAASVVAGGVGGVVAPMNLDPDAATGVIGAMTGGLQGAAASGGVAAGGGGAPYVDAITGAVVGAATPVALALLAAAQAAHEAGHAAAGAAARVPAFWPPRSLPGGPFAALGTTLRPSDYPRDARALFDFAAAGPAAGIVTSAAMLAAGLQATAAATPAAAALFPRMPTYLLQGSFLVGGIIDAALPNVALSAPDIAPPLTALHPLAYAGAAGLMLNALALVPLGGTDGAAAVSAIVPETPDSPTDVGLALLSGALQAVAGVCIGYQLWQAFFGDITQEGLLSAFVPMIVIFMGRRWGVVQDERPRVGPLRVAASLALQAFWLAVLLPMPLRNFLDGAPDAVASVGSSTGLF